ncbi:DgyrCDS9219 [Dimorphilus gyrociliatus]|uniref:DgyrCDS9219 n=1 Tax=Dimorphilus gyrociliatus TaxID=2664684 RepID=A0A7I8VWQ2_9ANNE|nr:DgyrCDS9219 [Dimorphilus gyrociliatus]
MSKRIFDQYKLYENSITKHSLPLIPTKWAWKLSQNIEKVEECLTICNMEYFCKAIDYNPNNQTCSLKSGYYGKEISFSHNVYVKIQRELFACLELQYSLYEESSVNQSLDFVHPKWNTNTKIVEDIKVCMDICNYYAECKAIDFEPLSL